MPNLFSYVPVVIFACVWASTFGFTRTATGRGFFQARGDAVDARQFRLAFHVEGINAPPQRELNFALRLAHAGEHALVRVRARRQRPAQFALAHDVEAAAERGERPQHRHGWNSTSWRSKSGGPAARARGPASDNAPSACAANKCKAACRICGPAFRPARPRNKVFSRRNENNAFGDYVRTWFRFLKR